MTDDSRNETSNFGAGDSASTLRAVINNSETVSKSFGISKIARPCAGLHKPPLPASPSKSDDTFRHVTDSFGKHTLTDLKEENEDDAFGGSLSKRGIGSMDAIWDTHGQRLTEAGLTRHQDNSVLTQDTDSFIIGDRIWVSGTKPGQIAYIGETQFAPGEWAGIVLDLPIGKNDGSVGGIRYFQCEPKRGIFSRLTRLTRIALLGADDSSICSSSYAVTSTPINNGVRKRVESPISPPGSVKSSLRSPPPFSVSNTSLSSIPYVIDYKIGDRVIIKSSQGSKIGTVRYIGHTDFAHGEWCGVELDDPRGKNNGTVDGKKYFECAPLYGLFAPVSKVSKSPLKHKPGNCVIHTSAGNLQSSIKRVGSKESMTSMTSSITSAASGARRVRLGINSLTPQQKAMTPKPINSTFSTRSALQDVLKEKQQHIEQLFKERDLDRAEFSKAAIHAEELTQLLSAVKSEYNQYRNETELKLREYVDVLTKLNKDRSITLSQLDDEKRKNEDLQFKFEEAAITKGDIEVDSKTQANKIEELQAQLEKERQKLCNLEGDTSKLFEAEEALVEAREEIEVLKTQLAIVAQQNQELSREKVESAEAKVNFETANLELQTVKECLEKLQTSSLNNQDVCAELNRQIQDYAVKLEEKSGVCVKQAEELTRLQVELDGVKQASEETESRLSSGLDKLKQELSGKIFDLESSSDVIKQKEEEIADLKASLLLNGNIEVRHQNDIERYKILLDDKTDETKTLTVKLDELDNTNKTNILELTKVKDQLEAATKELQHKTSEIAEAQTKLQENGETIERLRLDKDETVSKIQAKLESVNQKLTNEQTSNAQLKSSTDELLRKISSTETELVSATNEKVRLQSEIACLINSSGDYAEQMRMLNASLTAKENLLNVTKTELEDKLREVDVKNQEILVKLQEALRESEGVKTSYELKLQKSSESEASLQDLLVKSDESLGDAKRQVGELQNLLDETKSQVKGADDLSSKLQQLTKQLDEKETSLTSKNAELAEKSLNLSDLSELVERLRVELDQNKSAFDQQLEQAETDLQLRVKQLESVINEKEVALKDSQTENQQLTAKLTDASNLTGNTIEQLSSDLTTQRNLAASTEHTLTETVQELQLTKAELTDLKTSKTDLEKQLEETAASLQKLHLDKQTTDSELSSLQRSNENAVAQQTDTEKRLQETSAKLDEIKRNFDEIQLSLADKTEAECKLMEEVESDKSALQDLRKINEDITAERDGLKKDAEAAQELVAQLQIGKGNLELEKIEICKRLDVDQQRLTELTGQLESVSNQIKLETELNNNLKAETGQYVEIFKQLQLTDKQKQQLVGRLESSSSTLELIKTIPISNNEEQSKIVEGLALQLKDAQSQLNAQKGEVLRLQDALTKTQIKTPNAEINTTQNNNNTKSNDAQQLLEEKELAQGQIQFLNAIIVDMQRKNEEQQIRIELLESGFSPAAASELKLYGMPQGAIAPRMYCDICEEFDKHETDDCPIQGNDCDAPASRSQEKKVVPQRPYCDICEEFGHLTEDCKEDTTF